ncbi:hypothetical protein L2E82_20489 [Cichorium intybus]|uniref:Uncharacterized protein n=1 Tax=Cichorium intybus TaxID=13427 RepID=A0ACB9DTI0_CICIN|nr:hypothetical protein L2E82_20489 [Cichorium intybus]
MRSTMRSVRVAGNPHRTTAACSNTKTTASTNVEISPCHHIPLHLGDGAFNFIVEIPKESNAKMEVATDEIYTPIKQDTKKGKLRYYPYNINWNYGLLPQPWEDPSLANPDVDGVFGDNDPVDVVEIGENRGKVGQLMKVKPIGCLAMIDEGELDLKIVAISLDDPQAPLVNNVDDVDKHFPVEDDLQNGVANVVPDPSDEVGRQEVIAALVANVEGMTKFDRKITSLKQLQGHIWRTGFEKNELKGVVFDDVSWVSSKMAFFWSSIQGSEAELQLLHFLWVPGSNTKDSQAELRELSACVQQTTKASFTIENEQRGKIEREAGERGLTGMAANGGDRSRHAWLRSVVDGEDSEGEADRGWSAANKKERKSYVEISESLGVHKPSDVLFVTDVFQEAVILYQIKKQVLLFATSNYSSKVAQTFVDVARLFKGKLIFVYVEMDNEDVGKPVGDYFGITGDAPQGFLEEKLKAFYESDPIPENNDDDVKIVVGNNFEDIVLDESKDVLLEV